MKTKSNYIHQIQLILHELEIKYKLPKEIILYELLPLLYKKCKLCENYIFLQPEFSCVRNNKVVTICEECYIQYNEYMYHFI